MYKRQEVTRVEGPAPSIEEAVAAAGTISFFGTKRIVELPMLEPSAMNEADVGDVYKRQGSYQGDRC